MFIIIASFTLNQDLIKDYIKNKEGIKPYTQKIGIGENLTITTIHFVSGYYTADAHGKIKLNFTYTSITKPLFNASFQSTEVFAGGNPINYTIIATPLAEWKYEKMYMIFERDYDSYYSNKTKDIPLVLGNANAVGSLHELNEKNSTLFTLKNYTWSYPIEGKYSFYVVAINENNTYSISPKATSVLAVGSKLDKIQADTDIDLQKEILRTDFTNDIILEFTLIIVGTVPIGFGAEYFIEKHIYELEKSDRESEKTKNSINPPLTKEQRNDCKRKMIERAKKIFGQS